MSQENVEPVKKGIEAFNRCDADALAELTTLDFELLPALAATVEHGSYRRREGIDAYFADRGDTWEEARIFGEEFRDLGDRVLVLGRIQARGRGGGVPVDAPWGLICDFRGDKICCTRTSLDHGEALRAAGLVE